MDRQVRALKSSIESYTATFRKMVQSREPSFVKCAAEPRGLMDWWESFEFNFWLELFDQVFLYTDILYRKLQCEKN